MLQFILAQTGTISASDECDRFFPTLAGYVLRILLRYKCTGVPRVSHCMAFNFALRGGKCVEMCETRMQGGDTNSIGCIVYEPRRDQLGKFTSFVEVPDQDCSFSVSPLRGHQQLNLGIRV